MWPGAVNDVIPIDPLSELGRIEIPQFQCMSTAMFMEVSDVLIFFASFSLQVHLGL